MFPTHAIKTYDLLWHGRVLQRIPFAVWIVFWDGAALISHRVVQNRIYHLSVRQSSTVGKTLWELDAPVTHSLDAFTAHIKEVFDQTANALSVHYQLYNLHQGRSTVTLAAASSWNETALLTTYCQGLSPSISCLNWPSLTIMLDWSFISWSVQISQCLTACEVNALPLHPALKFHTNIGCSRMSLVSSLLQNLTTPAMGLYYWPDVLKKKNTKLIWP